MNIPEESPISWTAIAMALSAIVASWITARFSSKPAQRTADATAQTAINQGFEDLIRELRAELSASRQERGRLQLAIVNLRSAIRGLVQHIESLEAIMRQNGLTIPESPRRSMPGLEAVLTEVDIEITGNIPPAE